MGTGLTPNTREEMYYSAAVGETPTSSLPEPVTRKEMYLNAIANGSGGGGGFTPTTEQLAAMNSGITAEDVTQIGTNENNISSIQTTIGGIDETGNNYIELKSGLRLYISSTTPTGTIPVGSIGVGF